MQKKHEQFVTHVKF